MPGFWIAADDAYSCMNRPLTPCPGRHLLVAKDCFNYWQSSARIFIEQAFGILVPRWDVLWRPLSCTLHQNTQVVVVCCKLHNFIMDNNGGLEAPAPSGWDANNHTEEADRQIRLQDECDLDESLHCRRRDLDADDFRHDFTAEIKAACVPACRRRP